MVRLGYLMVVAAPPLGPCARQPQHCHLSRSMLQFSTKLALSQYPQQPTPL